MGGDEFAVLVPGPAELLEPLAQRIRRECSRSRSIDGVPVYTMASLGLAHALAADVMDLVRLADVAMYQAKRSGIGIAWSQAGGGRSPDRITRLLSELPGALEGGDIRPWYQPCADLRSGVVRRIETSPRWEHPEFGLVETRELLELVELAGLHAQLTSIMLNLTLGGAGRWPPHLGVAVTVSFRELQTSGFVSRVSRVLTDTGFEPPRLTLVVTSQGQSLSPDGAQPTLAELRELGVAVALDRFGTNAWPLASLHLLSVREVRIDSGLVGDLFRSPTVVELVRLIAGAGAALNLIVSADGVDHPEQAAVLAELGCAMGLGAWSSVPSPEWSPTSGEPEAPPRPTCDRPLGRSSRKGGTEASTAEFDRRVAPEEQTGKEGYRPGDVDEFGIGIPVGRH